MNPYLQIAREHLSTEDLEQLLAERKRPTPKPMTTEEQRRARLLENLNERRK